MCLTYILQDLSSNSKYACSSEDFTNLDEAMCNDLAKDTILSEDYQDRDTGACNNRDNETVTSENCLVTTEMTTLYHLKIITTAQIPEISTKKMVTGMFYCIVSQKYLLLNVFACYGFCFVGKINSSIQYLLELLVILLPSDKLLLPKSKYLF